MNYYWRKGDKYYKLILQLDLFGFTNIVCIWGKIGTNLGGYKVIICESEEDTKSVIASIQKRRKYRGYNAASACY